MQEGPRKASVGAVLDVIEATYPPQLAADWDTIGLTCGRRESPVRRILLAVDPVPAIVAEAVSGGFEMVVSHHPLFLSGVTSVAADTVGGRVVHELIEAGIALATAHTNADSACPGVSDALAAAIGVSHCTVLEHGPERGIGLGRIGLLEAPMSLAEFADRVALALPATHHGVRIAGDADRIVERVAVCGGSGDSLLTTASQAGADVYVTADLKHHRALDHVNAGGCAIVDVAHWASEWPWLDALAQVLRVAFPDATVVVSRIVTDPWTAHLRSPL